MDSFNSHWSSLFESQAHFESHCPLQFIGLAQGQEGSIDVVDLLRETNVSLPPILL